MAMRTRFIRTKFLTGRSVQLKYIALLVLSMVIPLSFVGGCLYYLIFNLMAEQLGIPEYIAYHLFPVIKKINLILLFGLPPLFILLILWGVVLTHRLLGPMERLEKEIERISKSGDYTKRLKLRRRDEIRSIVEAINRLLDRIEGKTS